MRSLERRRADELKTIKQSLRILVNTPSGGTLICLTAETFYSGHWRRRVSGNEVIVAKGVGNWPQPGARRAEARVVLLGRDS